MEIVYSLAGTILLVSVPIWMFLKIRNMTLAKKLNCRADYKIIKKSIKKNTVTKVLLIIGLAATVLFVVYVLMGIILFILELFLIFITLGGAAFVDTGADPSGYNNFLNFAWNYLKSFRYGSLGIYVIAYSFIGRAVYINSLVYKALKDKNNSNISVNGKSILILLMVIIILGVGSVGSMVGISFLAEYRSNILDLEDVVFPAMNTSVIRTPSWYFFHNDRIYVYENNEDRLISATLSAKDVQTIAASENLRYADFFMVYKGEAFYYTEYNLGVKKVNLDTGEITDVVCDKYLYLMQDTLDDSKVLVNYRNNYAGKSHTYFAYLDLETGTLTNEKIIKEYSHQPYFYDINSNKVYYIGETSPGYNSIYEDNEIIYTYKITDDPRFGNSDLAFVQDGCIYAVTGSKIIKIDSVSHSVIEEKETDKRLNLISCVRAGGARTLGIEEGPAYVALYPLFSLTDSVSDSEGDICKFNSSTMTFEQIIDKEDRGGFLQKYREYYILQTDTETVIYNDITGEYTIYDSDNYSLEDDYIYLMTYTGDFYHQKYDNLRFKIKKIPLDEAVN
ncbi:MAG: hypothetical protein ACI4EN_06610 [Butyrivibrio sp.]